MAEKPALSKNQADGRIRNCRAPGECAWPCPIEVTRLLPDLRTPRRRFPLRSHDTAPPGKARTSERRSIEQKRRFRGRVPRALSGGESCLYLGCPERASPAVHLQKQKSPGAQVP